MCLSDLPCASHLTFMISLKLPSLPEVVLSSSPWTDEELQAQRRQVPCPSHIVAADGPRGQVQGQHAQPPTFPNYPLKYSALPSTKHRPNQSRSLCTLTVVCHVEIGGFRPGAIACQGGGPHSHAVIPWGQPTQPAAPLQSEMPAGDAEVQLLENIGSLHSEMTHREEGTIRVQHASDFETLGMLEP